MRLILLLLSSYRPGPHAPTCRIGLICRIGLGLLCSWLACPLQPAGAAELALGSGAALTLDLPDAVGGEGNRFAPGGALMLPVSIGLTPGAGLRISPWLHAASGRDEVSWLGSVNGEPVRIRSGDHFALQLAAALTAGPELVARRSPLRPYLGAELGLGWFGHYHAFRGDTAEALLDPAQNELDDPSNIDPYTSQLSLISEAHVGLQPPLGERVAVFLETGYAVAFQSDRPLRKSPAEVDARREAYGWNAPRLAVGLLFSL